MPLSDWCPNLVTDHHTPTLDETASATFSPDRTYRYALTRRWDTTWPMAVFVMLNPSTADAFTVDPTIRRCIGFARSWHAGGILVANLFALRSTDPRALYRHTDPVGPDNDTVLRWVLSTDHEPVGPVVAAWGAHGAHQNRGDHITALLKACGVTPLCLGVTKDGHPRHPLYMPSSTIAVEFPQPAEVA